MEPEGRIWRRLREDRAGLAGLAVVSLFLMLALAVWLGLIGQDWSIAAGGRWEPPSPQHWFGTNILGQDIFGSGFDFDIKKSADITVFHHITIRFSF